MNKAEFFKSSLIFCNDTGEKCAGYTAYAKSKHWNNIRREKLKQQPQCYICGKKKTAKSKTKFNIHHKNYKNLGHENLNEDLVTLCEPCHKFIHKVKPEFPNLIGLPPEQILNYKKLLRKQNQRIKK